MTNKMPVVGKRYVNKKTNKDYELFFTHKEAFYLENTKDDLVSAETLVEFWNRFEELPEDNLQEKKEEQEVTLSEFEMLWGKPSYKSGLDLFATSHESASNSTKATAEDISTTELEEARENRPNVRCGSGNMNSVYTKCFQCGGWGIGLPDSKYCGNCSSYNTTKYFSEEDLEFGIATRDKLLARTEKGEVSEVERALEELEQAMSKSLGKIACVNDVNKITFKLMDVRKAAQNFVNAWKAEKKPKTDIKEECVEPVSIKKETYRCAHDYVLKNQGYNSIDYLVRQYECSICGENKMTIQS